MWACYMWISILQTKSQGQLRCFKIDYLVTGSALQEAFGSVVDYIIDPKTQVEVNDREFHVIEHTAVHLVLKKLIKQDEAKDKSGSSGNLLFLFSLVSSCLLIQVDKCMYFYSSNLGLDQLSVLQCLCPRHDEKLVRRVMITQVRYPLLNRWNKNLCHKQEASSLFFVCF